ncbi:hypothetical protein BRE01_63330 [Brevibacillus reuszeri]|uniref:Methionyl-tRNA formyltransferase n=1 Tax=Brevibacillus reuszeri TaxID=54915 RepID=A0A0K9YNU7_9BACL|nr:SgcJ/EcaC family oxidoreductase [Brevibacillus reuszeri]KNB70336.1 methionyl-tRNA formyltransferase [Brevibacillus reuszeri]MED1859301.1 SgcJ/EcaC family oxidoreductase [Brevibacillus reuszeri]GED72631.1 hypothetical protein BRE01_63330 [Brevibacillus reuszeri]
MDFYSPDQSSSTDENRVLALYQKVIEGWNKREADLMSEPFAPDGEMIGFDGTQFTGKTEIQKHLQEVFAHHPTPSYVTKIRSIRRLSHGAMILRALAGMIPAGKAELKPELNAHHSFVVVRIEEVWQVVLFQNTPAQFHGRPELVQQFTNELKTML